MTALSKTWTFTNGETIASAKVNTNFDDIITYINNRNSGSSTWDAMRVTSSTTVPLVVNNSTGTSNIANFQDNGTNVLTIANGGIVSMPYQSAIRVYPSGNQTIVDGGSEAEITFNTETFDIQSEYNTSTNRFVAATSGKYIVSAMLKLTGSSAGVLYNVYLKTTSGTTPSMGGLNYGTTETIQIFTVSSMSAGDTLYMTIQAPLVGTGNHTLIAAGSSMSIVKVA